MSDRVKDRCCIKNTQRMLTEKIKATIKDAARKLTGSKKRAFVA